MNLSTLYGPDGTILGAVDLERFIVKNVFADRAVQVEHQGRLLNVTGLKLDDDGNLILRAE